MRRTFALLGLLGMLAALLLAADASGKWTGTFEAGGVDRQFTFDLKSSGGALTGTVLMMPEKGTAEIKDGKVAGNNVTFWFMTEYQGNPIKLVCKGQLADNEIRFNMGLEDGQWSTDFVAKKGS